MAGFPRMVPKMLFAASAAAVLLAAASGGGVAQQAALDQQLAGSWRLTQDSVKGDGLGPKSNGMLIIGGANFALQIVNADMASFGSDDRRKATPAESQATGKGSLAYFGTYSANDADHSVMLHIARSSFPNWNGTDQKWIVTVAADKLTLTDAQNSGVALEWARVAPASGALLGTRGGRRIVTF